MQAPDESDAGLQSERSLGEPAGGTERPELEQCDPVADRLEAKGDDYNRNPVGTGPYILKSWTAGDRMVLEKNPDYWNKGHPYLDRIVLKPLPDAQSRFASLQSGEADIVWDDEYDADNIQKAKKDPKLAVHIYTGSGARSTRSTPRSRRSTTSACARRW